MQELGITKNRYVRIATEAALLGGLLERGLSTDLVVVSDDAGQFNVLEHALCWVDAERLFAKLVAVSESHREELEAVRTEIWEIYAALKSYREAPDGRTKARIGARFDALCVAENTFSTLNKALERMRRNKAELLLVLERPEVPLTNNSSERDIREYVKKRKISGSTRSDEGRRCRDTFTSLKKTCRKHGISLWAYLSDRVRGAHKIPPLSTYLRAHCSPPPPDR